MGIDTDLVYMLTFGFGSALTGLAGAVLVPIVGASPQLGLSYIAKAFITVIAGGPLPLLGTSAASAVFSTIDGIVSYHWSTVVSESRGAADRHRAAAPAAARHHRAAAARAVAMRIGVPGLSAAGERPGPLWWLAVAIVFIGLMVLPSFLNIAQQFNISIVFILALLALSMSFLWGYAGILSFGQTAFFGLGGYGFAVLALNLGETTFSLLRRHPAGDAVRGRARLFHDLRPHQRHLSERHHARRHPDLREGRSSRPRASSTSSARCG